MEINAGQHSLLRQFLSGLTNHRADDYGRDRALLLRELPTAARDGLGDGLVLGLRLCCDELAPWAGITSESALVALGGVARLIDYMVPVRGSGLTVDATRPDLHAPAGFNHARCAQVRVGGVLTVWQGSVVDPAAARAALGSGIADLVEMTRAQIADPDLVTHVRAGTPERIRPCTLSNQHSLVCDPRNPIVSDEAEPDAGHETLTAVAPAGPPREVLVVGGGRVGGGADGGPAGGTGCGSSSGSPGWVGRWVLVVGGGPVGLGAAATAAARGHRVVLCERDADTGGAVRIAAAAPGRAEFGHVVRDLLGECDAAGVTIRTGVSVDPDIVERVAPDVVVLATGARARAPGWASADREPTQPDPDSRTTRPRLAHAEGPTRGRVVDVRDVLSGRVETVGSVLVYDELGFHQAPAVAEWLAARGCRVEIMTPAMVVAQDLATTLDMELFHRRAHAAGITLSTDRVITSAVVGPGDGPRPVHRIGDCLAPRRVHAAIIEGDRVGVWL